MTGIYSDPASRDKPQPLDWAKGEGTDVAPGRFSVRVRIGKGEGAVERTLVGRFAWTLGKLLDAGDRGITSAELPAGIRLSHYIYRLRRDGIPVAAERERHGGEFCGSHARYRLAGQVTIVEGDVA